MPSLRLRDSNGLGSWAAQGMDSPVRMRTYVPQFSADLLPSSVVWVAYAFYAVPLIVSLSKLNIAASKSA